MSILSVFNLPIIDSNQISFSELSTDSVNNILNEYALHIGDALVRDEHTNAYNMFINLFIRKNNLIDKIRIIDLEDMEQMAIFPNLIQPSNKKYLTNWLNTKTRGDPAFSVTPYISLTNHLTSLAPCE